MFCCISGVAPEHPVVSKSGHLFERSAVEKYIETTGKDPISGEPLDAADLLPLKTTATVKPRPVAATSIPGMLTLFQNEWDALMLETHTLKQQLETVRQELGHALYQHDAACRVIARLMKERDDARAALAEARPVPAAAPVAPPAAPPATAAAPMDAEPAGPTVVLTAEVIATFDATSQSLSKGRKKRQPPAGYASAAALAAYAAASATGAHGAGAVCVDAHATERLVASGGADGRVVLAECADAAKPATRATLAGHTSGVSAVRLHPKEPLVLSSSLDGTSRVCRTDGADGAAPLRVLTAHSAAVTGLTLHATGQYMVTSSLDGSWALSSIESGQCLVRAAEPASAGYTCAGFHPDGLILATGTPSGVVRVWDVKSQSNAANFEGHGGAVTSVGFSENGFYLATGSADASVKLWDLRKLKNLTTLADLGAVGSVAFDFTGQFLAVGADELALYETKTWKPLTAFAAPATGVAFGALGGYVVGGAADGTVKLYA